MGVDRATVIITAPVPAVLAFLLRPRNLPRYLRGVPGSDQPLGATRIRRGRWAFAADPAQHRVRWWLLAPYRAAGTLDVYGDCSHSQLWLTVQQSPATMAPAEVHRATRTVLHRIRPLHRTGPRPPDTARAAPHRLTGPIASLVAGCSQHTPLTPHPQ